MDEKTQAKLAKLKQQKAKIEKDLQAIEAKEKNKERAAETRRKIILGGAASKLLYKLKQERPGAGEQLWREVREQMSEKDRQLFP